MCEIAVGTIRLELVNDAEVSISGDSVFYPAKRREWTKYVPSNQDGVIFAPVRPLLINDPAGLTLVDTGFGENSTTGGDDPEGRTLKELSARGIGTEDIKRVIITHAHGDHILGNTLLGDAGYAAVFPEAEYLLQRIEAEQMQSDSLEIWAARFEPVAKAGRLTLIDGNTKLTDTISCVLTEGHTIGHQSVVIASGGESACYLGHLALRKLNIERPEWGADWAWSREKDEENRRKIVEWARETGGVLILCHDPDCPFVRIDRHGNVSSG